MAPDQVLPRRRRDIQGLRAVAVLSVLAFHAGLPVPGGFVGVDVFFVISGFVITGMLHREWVTTGRINFGRFYIRRFKRLTPALAVMVAVTTFISALVLPPFGTQTVAAKTGLGAMLLYANDVIARNTGGYFDAPAGSNPLLNTWSLSVEEQFYLVFPAVIACGWLLTRRRARLHIAPLLLVSAIAAVSFFPVAVLSTGRVLPWTSWLLGFYSPLTRAWEFAAGALLALVLARITLSSTALARMLGLLGALLLALSLTLITEKTPFPGPWTLVPVVSTLLLLLGGTKVEATIWPLATTPIATVGDWSYSIYLWHWPAIVFATFLWPNDSLAVLLAAAFSLGPALVSYRFVERPARRFQTVSRSRLAVIVLTTIGLPVLAAAALSEVPRLDIWPSSVRVSISAISKDHAPTARGCMTRGPFIPGLVKNCEWNSNAAGTPIYLVGDSDAWHFAEAAIGAGRSLGRPVWILTAPSCPLISGLHLSWVLQGDADFSHCASYASYTLNWLQGAPPGIVVVSALDEYWWDSNISAKLGRDGKRTTDAVQKVMLLRAGLSATVRQLRHAGHQVIVVQTIPTYKVPTPFDPRTCSLLSILRHACFRNESVASIDALQGSSRRAIQEIARETGASVLDLRSWFCSQRDCSTKKAGINLYRDPTHLTVPASRSLAPAFAQAISSACRREVRAMVGNAMTPGCTPAQKH
jgi:peptidoglycan/LPS O-acetylase OafA/YrhL